MGAIMVRDSRFGTRLIAGLTMLAVCCTGLGSATAHASAARGSIIATAPGAESCASNMKALGDLDRQADALQAREKGIVDQQKKTAAEVRTTEVEYRALVEEAAELQKKLAPVAAKIESLRAQIAAHNSEPVDQTDAAAVSAYNARASQLNGRAVAAEREFAPLKARGVQLLAKIKAFDSKRAGQRTLTADLQRKTAEIRSKLGELDKKSDANKLQLRTCLIETANNGAPSKYTPGQERRVGDAKNKVPASWSPPAAPSNRAPRLLQTDPARPLRDELRANSPPRKYPDVELQGKPRPKVGDVDESQPCRKIVAGTGGEPAVSPDHIVPIVGVMSIPGFMELTAGNMLVVLNARINLQWLSRTTNSAKQDYAAAALSCYSPTWRAGQTVLEKAAERRLRELIKNLSATQ